MPTKKWYQSKTILLGITEIIVGVYLGIEGGTIVSIVGITAAICGAIQGILRLVSSRVITK